jgi:hypothetical protein
VAGGALIVEHETRFASQQASLARDAHAEQSSAANSSKALPSIPSRWQRDDFLEIAQVFAFQVESVGIRGQWARVGGERTLIGSKGFPRVSVIVNTSVWVDRFRGPTTPNAALLFGYHNPYWY